MVETVLSFIGLIVIVKFCVRNKGAIMDKDKFWRSVKSLREGIVHGWGKNWSHNKLDEIIENVTGEPDMENLEDNLARHIVSHIKAVKAAKAEEKLQDKAKEIIKQIQKALED